jgi:hypothetical protein
MKTQCVPATQLARRRRRRLPEQDLLGRLRHYEGLLNKNNIPFEPIDEPSADQTYEDPCKDGLISAVGVSSGDLAIQESETQKNEAVFETKCALPSEFDVHITDIHLGVSGTP